MKNFEEWFKQATTSSDRVGFAPHQQFVEPQRLKNAT